MSLLNGDIIYHFCDFVKGFKKKNHYKRGNFKSPAKFGWKKIIDELKTPHFTDRNKIFLTFLKTFEITSKAKNQPVNE